MSNKLKGAVYGRLKVREAKTPMLDLQKDFEDMEFECKIVNAVLTAINGPLHFEIKDQTEGWNVKTFIGSKLEKGHEEPLETDNDCIQYIAGKIANYWKDK